MQLSEKFAELQGQIMQIGLDYHRETILANSRANASNIQKTIRDIQPDERPCLVISAGPSLYRRKILHRLFLSGFDGTVIAVDGAYIQCLKAEILPDWVVTLDPHPTRMVRWFGDPDFQDNEKGDDYFRRQDLDVRFRSVAMEENEANIKLVDENRVPLAVCSTISRNLEQRTRDFERYWFAPLVDDPEHPGLTKQMVEETGLPALNTGGTVGTAAILFALRVLKSRNIAVVGCDFGYPMDTPLSNTQEWNMLKSKPNVETYYPKFIGHWGECYTSPTYYWYMKNLLDLLEAANARITNCTEGGILMGERVDCMNLDEWLKAA